MVKRKQHPGPSFPREIQLHPAALRPTDADATGPFAAYFASGYCPSNNDSATFEVHRHVERPREHCLLLRKVRPTKHVRLALDVVLRICSSC